MLEASFLHFDGIGPIGEGRLWQRGFLSWDDVCDRGHMDRVASCSKLEAEKSRVHLGRRNAPYFANRLPATQRWRLYDDFLGEAAFLDIETSGLGPGKGVVTLVGILDATGFKAFIRGENLDELPEAIERYRLVVTFNGAAFDLPYLEAEFAQVTVARGVGLFDHTAHIDLRYPLRRVGLSGGLKAIERLLGVGRPDELSLLTGFDAIRMWRLYCDGDLDALATLVRYNAEDVASLPKLASYAVGLLSRGTPLAAPARCEPACGPATPTPKIPMRAIPDIDRRQLPFDPALVGWLARGRTAAIG